MTPFDFVNAIQLGKNILSEENEHEYTPFIINRALSFGADTVIAANEVNCRPHMSKRMQNVLLINMIEPRKRYNKWIKAVKKEDLDLICEYYGYSYKKAKDVLPLLSNDQMERIKEKLYKGGS